MSGGESKGGKKEGSGDLAGKEVAPGTGVGGAEAVPTGTIITSTTTTASSVLPNLAASLTSSTRARW
jgi:hypothetical protein